MTIVTDELLSNKLYNKHKQLIRKSLNTFQNQ